MDGAQNTVYYAPEYVHVQTVLGMSLHELKMKVLTIDMLVQEFEPKRKSIMQRENRILIKEKVAKF